MESENHSENFFDTWYNNLLANEYANEMELIWNDHSIKLHTIEQYDEKWKSAMFTQCIQQQLCTAAAYRINIPNALFGICDCYTNKQQQQQNENLHAHKKSQFQSTRKQRIRNKYG